MLCVTLPNIMSIAIFSEVWEDFAKTFYINFHRKWLVLQKLCHCQSSLKMKLSLEIMDKYKDQITTMYQTGTLSFFKMLLHRTNVNGQVKGRFQPHFDLLMTVG